MSQGTRTRRPQARRSRHGRPATRPGDAIVPFFAEMRLDMISFDTVEGFIAEGLRLMSQSR